MLDLRNQLLPVGDQGRRGTCVAFAATSAHEFARQEQERLSIEFLHWGAKQRDGMADTEGTTIEAAAASLADVGQPPESLWPYDDCRDSFNTTYQPPSHAKAEAKLRRISSGSEIEPTATDIRETLEEGVPVILGVRLFTSWYFPGTDGKISLPGADDPSRGGHAVLIVGFEVGASEEESYFLIRNSWGTSWGLQGYALLPFAFVDRYGVTAWQLGS